MIDQQWHASCVVDGKEYTLVFRAFDEEEAERVAAKWGASLVGVETVHVQMEADAAWAWLKETMTVIAATSALVACAYLLYVNGTPVP